MSALFREDGSEERYSSGKRAWKCDHCGLVSAWTETWVCFGAIEDDPYLMTFCCREHGDEHERAVPQFFSKSLTVRRFA